MIQNYYVYIVECSDGSYYIGVTNDLERRVIEHNRGLSTNAYTFNKRPVKLKYYAHFHDINQAIAWEKQIKGWSKKKKDALIDENWELVKVLATRYT